MLRAAWTAGAPPRRPASTGGDKQAHVGRERDEARAEQQRLTAVLDRACVAIAHAVVLQRRVGRVDLIVRAMLEERGAMNVVVNDQPPLLAPDFALDAGVDAAALEAEIRAFHASVPAAFRPSAYVVLPSGIWHADAAEALLAALGHEHLDHAEWLAYTSATHSLQWRALTETLEPAPDTRRIDVYPR